jgi:hypothetical protein
MDESERPNEVPEALEPVVLIIADISGYTRYMTANAKTLAHSQTIITELVKTIVKQVDLPLEVAKLEGDAVFLFGRKGFDPRVWAQKKKAIGEKLFTFFESFTQRLNELSFSTTCTCTACTHIEKLRLKVVVHSGEALFHQVLHFHELAGVDVIIVHRLLKNSVQAEQYLLMTEAAQQDVELPNQAGLVIGSETYEDIGRIKTGVYYPTVPGAVPHRPAKPTGFTERFRKASALLLKLWFKPLAGKRAHFRHLESTSTRAGRWAFAVLTLLMTPFFLPVGTALILFRSLKKPPGFEHKPHNHEHAADGSCCKP